MVLPEEFMEQEAYEEDEFFHIYYEEDKNLFFYEGNYIIYNIFTLLTPNEVFLFKHNKEDVFFVTPSGDPYILYYEKNEEYLSGVEREMS